MTCFLWTTFNFKVAFLRDFFFIALISFICCFFKNLALITLAFFMCLLCLCILCLLCFILACSLLISFIMWLDFHFLFLSIGLEAFLAFLATLITFFAAFFCFLANFLDFLTFLIVNFNFLAAKCAFVLAIFIFCLLICALIPFLAWATLSFCATVHLTTFLTFLTGAFGVFALIVTFALTTGAFAALAFLAAFLRAFLNFLLASVFALHVLLASKSFWWLALNILPVPHIPVFEQYPTGHTVPLLTGPHLPFLERLHFGCFLASFLTQWELALNAGCWVALCWAVVPHQLNLEQNPQAHLVLPNLTPHLPFLETLHDPALTGFFWIACKSLAIEV